MCTSRSRQPTPGIEPFLDSRIRAAPPDQQDSPADRQERKHHSDQHPACGHRFHLLRKMTAPGPSRGAASPLAAAQRSERRPALEPPPEVTGVETKRTRGLPRVRGCQSATAPSGGCRATPSLTEGGAPAVTPHPSEGEGRRTGTTERKGGPANDDHRHTHRPEGRKCSDDHTR